MSDDNSINRWTAKRKAAVVMDIFKARPKDIRERCESEFSETKEALGEAHLQVYALGV